MSQSEETMHDQETDLLAPRSTDGLATNPDSQTAGRQSAAEDGVGAGLPGPEPTEATAPRDPLRRLVRLGWAMVVVLVVLAALAIAGMLRISNAVNRVACIQRAQANYAATTGPGTSAYALSLARLSIKLSLNKCGQ